MSELNETAMLHNYLLVGGLMLAIGMIGLLVRRNLIVMFLSVEIMLQGVSLSLVAWSRYWDDWGGQMLVLFVIAVAACEAALAMALILAIAHRAGSLDMVVWQDLREETVAPYVDREIPEERVKRPAWPLLPVAGRAPMVDEQADWYRSGV